MKKYFEKVFRFGDDNCLAGVISEPDINSIPIQKIGVIILNAGLIHRVGLQRMSTEIARELSSKGFLSFRVDLYGIGDSIPHKGDKSFAQRIFKDIQESMDFISGKYDITKFILIGHCAGADNAHFVSVLDDRVVGVVFMDGFGYPTLSFKLIDHGGESKVNAFKWAKTVIKFFLGLFLGKPEQKNLKQDYGRRWPSYEEAKNDIRDLIRRKVELLYVYTGGVPVYYNYGNQFRDMFKDIDFGGKVTVKYIKEADHNLTLIDPRNEVKNLLLNWVIDRFISQGKR